MAGCRNRVSGAGAAGISEPAGSAERGGEGGREGGGEDVSAEVSSLYLFCSWFLCDYIFPFAGRMWVGFDDDDQR